MKVTVRKPVGHYSSLAAEEFLEEKLNISEKWAERICYPLDRWCRLVNWTLREVFPRKSHKVKIDYWDTWSMDHTLSLIILPMLKQLKDKQHGAPFVDCEDVPEQMRWTEEQRKEVKSLGHTPDNHFERWDYILDRMIYSFDYIANDRETDKREEFITIDHDALYKKFGKSANSTLEIMLLQEKNGIDLVEQLNGPRYYSTDWEKLKEHEEYVDEGFRLFGKYYRGLWD